MSGYASKDVGALLIGGRSILASVTDVDTERKAAVVKTTPLGVTWAVYGDTGLREAVINQQGWFDAAADAENDALCGREGTSQVLCLTHAGNIAGRVMLACAGIFAGVYKRILAGTTLHRATATHTVSGEVEDAVILQPLATLTTPGNTDTTGVDNAAATSTGGAGYLQVQALALGGYTNATVKVRHSSDNATYVDLLTFAAVTVAPAAERKTVAGSVYQYLSTSLTFTGAGSGASITFLVGFSRNS